MLSKTNWKAWLVLGAAVALVLASGLVMASNVGFKINKGLKTPFLAPGPAGDNWISIPYNSPYTNFTNLCNAFFAAGAPKANTTISRLDPATGVFTNVQCLAGNAAALVAGQGLRVRITTVTLPSVILVGSSNEASAFPTFVGAFVAPGPKGDNWTAYPYHTTWVKANDVCGTLGLGLGQGTVSRIDSVAGTFTNFQCGSAVGGATNFSLVIGESVRVRKNTAGNLAGVLPPHF